ncbi:hypothetical protein [Tunturiibacter empetritectus]|uniref:hypothetical protein n=1 Tax=Tunturiibacter empetritectus TaxID=3069691 RepID=UPI003D9B450B
MASLGLACEESFDLRFELLPGGVDGLCAGQGVESSGFDAMDQLLRLAVRGDEVEPAAGDVGVGVEAEDRVGEGVAVVVVVEEPAVDFIFSEGLLDGGEVESGLALGVGDDVRHGTSPPGVKSAQSLQTRRHESGLTGQVFAV